MSLIQNKPGLLSVPSCGYAGVIHQHRFSIAIPEGLAQGDIIELGVLIAGARFGGFLVDADLQEGMVVDIGFMSGEVGSDDPDRTCGNQIFDDLSITGNLASILTGAPLRLAKSDVDRSIGVKIVTPATTPAPGGLFAIEVAYIE